jgi:hypothetical protein
VDAMTRNGNAALKIFKMAFSTVLMFMHGIDPWADSNNDPGGEDVDVKLMERKGMMERTRTRISQVMKKGMVTSMDLILTKIQRCLIVKT